MIKKILIVFGLLFFSLGVAKAQETPEEIAAGYGVTFPVAELAGCQDYQACRDFCEDPVNYDTCVAFAKDKGFYEEEDYQPDERILGQARQVLGCNSYESCKNFCEREENFDQCHSFAQRVGIAGGYSQDPTSRQFLNQAQEVLGCDSYESCRSFCDNPANRDRCAQFAQSVGARGGYEYRGPGGCTSEDTCRTFCSDPANYETCRQYSRADEPAYDPAGECQKYSGCSWSGSYCQCQSSESDLERWKTECVKYSGCAWSGTSCQCSGSGTGTYSGNTMSREQQEATCNSGGGTCQWNDNICNCQGYQSSGSTGGSYSTPYPYSSPTSGETSTSYSGSTMTREQQESTCNSGGGTCQWNGDICNCQGYSSGGSTSTTQTPAPTTSTQTTDPATQCNSYPGCSWNGSGCYCSSVQGVTTYFLGSWWDRLLAFLRSR